MRRALLTTSRGSVTLPAIGDAFMGGYYVGIIDTTKGNIIAADASQTGLRYALIVAPKSLESTQAYRASGTAPLTARTRWDGLTATAALVGVGAGAFPAANYCNGLTYPVDAASSWYLPAMDEFELIYRNLKATTENNNTSTLSTIGFPGTTGTVGTNPSSDPSGAGYTAASPAQTAVTAFRSGGTEALGSTGSTIEHWTSTDSGSGLAWRQRVSGISPGIQERATSTDSKACRPVRRLLL